MEQLVWQLNGQTGCGLRVVGIAALGETGGAALVEWPDGRRSVVTPATVPVGVMHQTAKALEVARAHGCPVPKHELVVELPGHVVAVVQERLPGEHPVGVDADLIDTLVAANDGFVDLLTGRPELVLPEVDFSCLGSTSVLHEPLEQYNDRSRRLLRQLQHLDQPVPRMSELDLVHSDLTVSNILLEADTVSGVIDWNNGALRGDRHFALVKLLFDLIWEAAEPSGGRHRVQASGIGRLETVLHDTVDPDRLRSYWAYWTLQMLHWIIPSANTSIIDLHVDLGERGLC